MKALICVVVFLFAVGLAVGQTPAPAPVLNTSTFSVPLNAITLPGNTTSLAGVMSGATVAITPNFSLRQTTFVSTNSVNQGYFGGVDYTIAPFSTWLNNLSPSLNGLNLRLQLTGSVGDSRLVGSTSTANHVGYLFGGRLQYAIAGSANYSLGIEIQDLNSPGFAKRNNLVIAVGPTFHF